MSKFDLTIEQVEAAYFNEDALREAPVKLFRLDAGGMRNYYTFDNGRVKLYVGVTSFLSRVLPTSEHLIKWIADKGYDEANRYKNERAEYGTFMHMQHAELAITRKYNLDLLKPKLEEYIKTRNVDPELFNEWASELKKDILAFAQWILDYDVKILAVELPLKSDKWGFSGTMDIFCELNREISGDFGEFYKTGKNAGQPKASKKTIRSLAVVDEKSGRKGFGESAALQLECYKILFKENFPKYANKDIAIYNWSPKEWRKSPTYNFIDQTDCITVKKLPYLMELFKIDNDVNSNSLLVTEGMIDLSKGSIENNFTTLQYTELIQSNHDKIMKENEK